MRHFPRSAPTRTPRATSDRRRPCFVSSNRLSSTLSPLGTRLQTAHATTAFFQSESSALSPPPGRRLPTLITTRLNDMDGWPCWIGNAASTSTSEPLLQLRVYSKGCRCRAQTPRAPSPPLRWLAPSPSARRLSLSFPYLAHSSKLVRCGPFCALFEQLSFRILLRVLRRLHEGLEDNGDHF